MRLVEYEPIPDERVIPQSIQQLIESGKQKIEQFNLRTHRDRNLSFHASDFEMAYQWLVAIKENVQSKNVNSKELSFVEWGAGIPVVAAMASSTGMKSRAIEIDERLCQTGNEWLATINADVELIHDSFVPDQCLAFHSDQELKGIDWRPSSLSQCSANSIVGNIVYAYPWPNEEGLIEEIFRTLASPDDWLITFHGSLMFRAHYLVPE